VVVALEARRAAAAFEDVLVEGDPEVEGIRAVLVVMEERGTSLATTCEVVGIPFVDDVRGTRVVLIVDGFTEVVVVGVVYLKVVVGASVVFFSYVGLVVRADVDFSALFSLV